MKPSAYNHFVEGNGVVYAVNLLVRSAMELTPEAYEVYREAASGQLAADSSDEVESLLFSLREHGFLVADEFDELAHVRYRTRQERFDRRQLGLVIAPTMGCNFNCHYCFENKIDSTLSRLNQARLVELVARELPGRESLAVQWFGGEPLAALPVIETLSEAFIALTHRLGISYAATVITNGYLMSADVSRALAGHGVRVAQITLDGDRAQHDRVRFEKRKSGSFDTILDNIREASGHLQIKLRVHVAPYNRDSVFDLLDTLAKEGLQQHVAEIYFAPLFNYRTEMKGVAYATDSNRFMSSRDFAGVQPALLRRADELGFRIPDMLDVSYGICTAVRDNTLVIDSEGALHKCYKDVGVESAAVGNVVTGLQNGPKLQKWMDVEPPRDEECRSCRFLPVCLGGCGKQWQEKASKAVICTPLKFNMHQMLPLYFERKTQPTDLLDACCD